jgi:tetratricopeptide (TPR) repeat protein
MTSRPLERVMKGAGAISLVFFIQAIAISQVLPPPEHNEVVADFLAKLRGSEDWLDKPGGRGVLAGTQGSAEQIVSVARLLHQVPKAARQAYNHAGKLARQGNVDEAIRETERAIAIDPEFAEAYNDLGVRYAGLARFQEAETQFRRTIELMPGSPIGYSNWAWVLLKLGNREEAEWSLRRALQLAPSDITANQLLRTIKTK